jgi:hypothetical protein
VFQLVSRFAYEEHSDFYWSPHPNIYSNHHALDQVPPPAFSDQIDRQPYAYPANLLLPPP